MNDAPTPAGPLEDDPRNSEVVLEVRGVTKNFGPLSVLRGIDLNLHSGEVLGLVGDNGAGKSTLVKILSGLFSPDEGRLSIKGREVRFHSVEDASAHGIETVYQDLALIPQLPVFSNLFLNHEITYAGPLRLLNKRKMRELARRYLDDINVYIPNVSSPGASGRRSPLRALPGQMPASSCSTNRWQPWEHASHGSSST